MIPIVVEQDHIESLTKASGTTALAELIWNSLDADATQIHISCVQSPIEGYESISITDNGHGLTYFHAEEVFKKLGGSAKRDSFVTPNGRSYHGKEGKGRYKAFALGDLVRFESVYIELGVSKRFELVIDRNNLKNPKLSDLEILPDLINSGFKVTIYNPNQNLVTEAFSISNRNDLEEKFVQYYTSYPTFDILVNDQKLLFNSLIKNSYEETIRSEVADLSYIFKIKIVEWNFDNKKKTYFCNSKGIPFREYKIGIRSGLPISIFVESNYIERLHRENTLAIAELDPTLNDIWESAKEIARKYVREQLHHHSREFIDNLKKDHIYPYDHEPTDEIGTATRQVFDIVALQINEYVPNFNDQDKRSKGLTMRLVKEALESDSSNLQKILTEVIGLPDDKREELSELLDKTSLSNIIDTMKDITHRLNFLHGLELLIYDSVHSLKIKERKHLHQILVNETWIFGDEYTYGADDITLKNVLKEYVKSLGRDDFEEVVQQEDNSDLRTIPDVCLWRQFSTGHISEYRNLVIELKKPTVDGGFAELNQIQSYAQKVARDARFPKEHTRWTFVLLVRDVKDEIEPQLNQANRRYGHVFAGDHFDVWVIRWGNIIHEAKARYKYVKDKLDISFKNNNDALSHLKAKYNQYLPDEFAK